MWLPEAGGSGLFAVTEPAYSSLPGHERVFIPSLPSVEHILIDPTGRQHVVLRANGAAIQLTIEGADITARPIALTFLVRGIGAIGRACDQFDLLRRILSPARAPSSALPRWTTRTQNLRDALITLDGRRAGASYREIATVLYGAKTVAEDWHKGLKERMHRHFKRGAKLSDGGYRDFLR